jgi:hypothetical protein
MIDFQLQKLLGRDEIEWDLDEIAAYITDQPVLVTGAGRLHRLGVVSPDQSVRAQGAAA